MGRMEDFMNVALLTESGIVLNGGEKTITEGLIWHTTQENNIVWDFRRFSGV